MKIKLSKKVVSILSICAFLFPACSGNNTGTQIPENSGDNPVAVVITPNTAMRVDPLLFTSRVALLKKGEVAEIIEKSTDKKAIGKDNDYWYKLKLPNGITGWVFGANISILKDADRSSVESYLSQFWEKETEELSTAMHGKWWSVNRFNDFTNHCLELYKDGKYKSYLKGATKKLEGEYNFDFNKNEIVFLGETSFEGNLTFVKRGDTYTLSRETDKDEIRFKKINVNPESESEDPKLQEQDNGTDISGRVNENPSE